MQCENLTDGRHCTHSFFFSPTGLDTYEEEEEFFYRNLSEEVVGDDQLIRLM